MGGGHFGNAGAFLIETLFGVYMIIVALRFLLQVVRADARNPVSQFTIKLTQPVLVHLRRFVPGLGGLDMASLVFLLLLALIELTLLFAVSGLPVPALPGLLMLALAKLVELFINIFFFALLLMIVLSFLQTGYHPVAAVIYALAEPVVAPFRRVLPPISGLDLSPIPAFLMLGLLRILLVGFLTDIGRALS